MQRLNPKTLVALNPGVTTPGYPREQTGFGIVHLGLGAFHRAHQAVYTDAAMRRSGGDWGIVGVSMRSDTVARQLGPQEGLYSVLAESGEARSLQVIGALQRVIVAPAEPQALDAVLADPAIRIVTLTITEKGYCLDSSGWHLDRDLPDIQHDLAQPAQARSAIGLLARGLEKRREQGGAPLTILSCDNLAENSARLRAVLLEYAEGVYPQLAPWLESAVAFPSSMVDRIVPAMTDTGRDTQSVLLGLRDEAAVATEPFSQWIIEDSFAAGRPDWENVGVQLVADIRPYEALKLRLLNASHSAIAYFGLLAGRETVSDVMADAPLKGFIQQLMNEELIPALDVPAGFDVSAYRDQLLTRFANPSLRHRCAQIAMDGSEKIRQRWLPTFAVLPEVDRLTRALAAWCYFVLSTDLPLEDARREQLQALRESTDSLEERIAGLVALLNVELPDAGARKGLYKRLSEHYATLAREGVPGLLNPVE